MLTNAENLKVVPFLFHKIFGSLWGLVLSSFSQKAENWCLDFSFSSFLAHSDNSTSQYTLVFKHRLRLKFDNIRLVLKGFSKFQKAHHGLLFQILFLSHLGYDSDLTGWINRVCPTINCSSLPHSPLQSWSDKSQFPCALETEVPPPELKESYS